MNILAKGVFEHHLPEELQFPPDGSPTLTIGARVCVSGQFRSIERPDGWPIRKYTQGDDYYFDFTRLTVWFEWGPPNKRKRKSLKDIHLKQQDASPQVEELPHP